MHDADRVELQRESEHLEDLAGEPARQIRRMQRADRVERRYHGNGLALLDRIHTPEKTTAAESHLAAVTTTHGEPHEQYPEV